MSPSLPSLCGTIDLQPSTKTFTRQQTGHVCISHEGGIQKHYKTQRSSTINNTFTHQVPPHVHILLRIC
jgi:hypothetical protein